MSLPRASYTARPIILAAVVAVGLPSGGRSQEGVSWVGKHVFTKYGTVLKVGDKVVNDENRSRDRTTSGRDRRVERVYQVKRSQGLWLWLVAENDAIVGWVKVGEVIPCERATDHWTDLIRSSPTSDHYALRGTAWAKNGEFEKALSDFSEAIRLDPHNEAAYANRGNIRAERREPEKALSDYSEAIRLDPKFAGAYSGRAAIWSAVYKVEKALADYSEAIRLDPENSAFYNNRGIAWGTNGKYAQALSDYSEAIRLDPLNFRPYQNRAWLWATCPADKVRDGKKAVESAQHASELSEWKDALSIATLAAACAEVGDFEAAVRWEQMAQGIYADTNDKNGGLNRLAFYRIRWPYRETLKPN